MSTLEEHVTAIKSSLDDLDFTQRRIKRLAELGITAISIVEDTRVNPDCLLDKETSERMRLFMQVIWQTFGEFEAEDRALEDDARQQVRND